MDPAAKWVVERDVVFSDESPRRRCRPEAAQADTLRAGIRDQRWRRAEVLDAGKLAELIVERDARGGSEGLPREDAGGRRAFESAERSAIGSDGDLFRTGGGLELNGCGCSDGECLRSEAGRGDGDAARSGADDGERTGSVSASEKMIG